VAHFGFPVEFHLVYRAGEGAPGLGGRPQILLAVSSLDSFSRHRVQGYGHVSFPSKPGAHDLSVRTWRPDNSVRARVQEFFVGGAHRLNDPRYMSRPGSCKGTFLSRFGFRTESSGTVRLRMYIVEQVQNMRIRRANERGDRSLEV
ncbi:unnamed protein product, partial [Discosporangium mesarthrocarpum]